MDLYELPGAVWITLMDGCVIISKLLFTNIIKLGGVRIFSDRVWLKEVIYTPRKP